MLIVWFEEDDGLSIIRNVYDENKRPNRRLIFA